MQVQSRGCCSCTSSAARHGAEMARWRCTAAGNPRVHAGARRQPQHQRPRPRAARSGPRRAGSGPAGTCAAALPRSCVPMALSLVSLGMQPVLHDEGSYSAQRGEPWQRGNAHAAAVAAAQQEHYREYRAFGAEDEPWREEVFAQELAAAFMAASILCGPPQRTHARARTHAHADADTSSSSSSLLLLHP